MATSALLAVCSSPLRPGAGLVATFGRGSVEEACGTGSTPAGKVLAAPPRLASARALLQEVPHITLLYSDEAVPLVP